MWKPVQPVTTKVTSLNENLLFRLMLHAGFGRDGFDKFFARKRNQRIRSKGRPADPPEIFRVPLMK